MRARSYTGSSTPFYVWRAPSGRTRGSKVADASPRVQLRRRGTPAGSGLGERQTHPLRPTSNCVRRGAPPPAPPRSFLTERGEVDRAATSIELAPDGAPPTRLGSHLPQKPLGEVDFDPDPTKVRRTSLPRAVCGGGPGRGAAHHPAPRLPKLTAACPTPTSPSLFWGRCEPKRAEGAPRVAPPPALRQPRRWILPRVHP
jgi:hypothetical protein